LLRRASSGAEVIGRGEHADAVDLLAEVASEVPDVARDQVRGSSGNRSTEDRPVLFGKVDLRQERLGCGTGMDHLQRRDQAFEAVLLRWLNEISLRLLDGVAGAGQADIFEGPQNGDAGILAPGGGEEDVGVQEETIHQRLRTVVSDRIRLDAHAPDRFSSSRVVFLVGRIGQKELGPTFGGV
jgi:hypothetical protein